MNEKDTHLVFYRKYRPRLFAEVVGQTHVVTVLENAIAKNRVAHAYLFSGPRGCGKTTVARILARSLGCESEDIVEIDAASSRGIDEARALREAVRFLPLRSSKKIYIIDEVHMLTKEAFNALLKTLEEPPDHVVFVLATTELGKVLDTVVSRTQHFSFHKISIPDIVGELRRITNLEKFSAEDDALKLIAFFADGSLRDAENMLLQVRSFSASDVTEKDVRLMLGVPEEEYTNKLLESALSRNTAQMLDIFDNVLKTGIDPQMLSRLLLRSFRALYFLSLDKNTESLVVQEFSRAEVDHFKTLIASFGNSQSQIPAKDFLENAVVLLLKALQTPTDDFLPQLPLELALIKIVTR